MHRRPPALVAIAVGLVTVLQVNQAAAYQDTGYDPDDRPVLGDPDVRSTTRFVGRLDGHQVVSVSVRAYAEFGVWWFINVRIDSRGGPRADYRMRLWNGDMSGRGCSLKRIGTGGSVRGVFDQQADRASCRVFIRRIQSTKRIRWKLVSRSGHSGGITEYAPNGGGWYE